MIHQAGLFLLGWLALNALLLALWMIAVDLYNSFGREPQAPRTQRPGSVGLTPLTPPSRPNNPAAQ